MDKKNRKRIIYLVLILSIIAVLICLWVFMFKKENPIKIMKSIDILKSGRGYEILEEENKYITKDDNVSNLMQFLEGHYEYRYLEQRENLMIFIKDEDMIVFEIKRVFNGYLIWELKD